MYQKFQINAMALDIMKWLRVIARVLLNQLWIIKAILFDCQCKGYHPNNTVSHVLHLNA